MGGKAGADTLLDCYGKESDVQVRRAVIDALSFQGNADVLVSLARKETNPGAAARAGAPAVVHAVAGRGRVPHGDPEQVGGSLQTDRPLGLSPRGVSPPRASPRSLTPVNRTMNSCAGASPA